MIDLQKIGITRAVAVAACALVLCAGVFGGLEMSLSAIAGGALATADAFALVWLASRTVSGGIRSRGFAAALLGAKLVLVGALAWALIARFNLSPLGFGVGFSALVLGNLYAAVEHASNELAVEREA